MTRRALILASQTYGLQGCDADAELMRATLSALGFECDVRTGGDATRAGIVDGVDRLAAASGPGDAAVVYYSGHGGRVARPDAAERRATGRSAYFQFIVPFDIDESGPDDFRGLLSEELSALQARLTDAYTSRGATPNVTMILDCCHSGYLARDTTLVPRFVELDAKMFPLLGIRVRASQLDPGAGLRTNPDAVRLVACQEEQSAFEKPSARGGRHGVLTDAFATLLDGLGDRPVSWTVAGDALRRAVQLVAPDQRPDVEGPDSTLLFSVEREPAIVPTVPVEHRDGTLVIEAASVLGLAAGDEVALVDAVGGADVGRARVRAVVEGTATLTADPSPPAGIALRAAPRRLSLGRRRVAIDVPGPLGDELRRGIGTSPLLSTDDGPEPVFATVRGVGDGLTVQDDMGAPMMLAPAAGDAAGQQRVLDVLATMANGRRLRELPSGAGAARLDADVDVRFATVADGVTTDRARHGERLAVGTAVALTLANLADAPRYAWVFDVCLAGRVTLLTAAAPSGTLLEPRGRAGDVRSVLGAAGSPLFWPGDVPAGDPAGASGARPESLVVVVADRRQDLSSLTEPPGGTRDGTDDDLLGTAFRYRVETIDFLVVAA